MVAEALKGSSAGNRQRLDSITQVTPKKFPKFPRPTTNSHVTWGSFEDCHSDLIAGGLSCPGNPHKAKQLVPASPASCLRDVSSNRWRCRADLQSLPGNANLSKWGKKKGEQLVRLMQSVKAEAPSQSRGI